MDEENKRERERENVSQFPAHRSDLKPKLLMALIIIGVVAFGLLAVNQFLEFRFKSIWLSDPCGLCEKANSHFSDCFKDASNVVVDKRTGEIVEEEEYKIKIDLNNFTWPEQATK